METDRMMQLSTVLTGRRRAWRASAPSTASGRPGRPGDTATGSNADKVNRVKRSPHSVHYLTSHWVTSSPEEVPADEIPTPIFYHLLRISDGRSLINR